MHYRLFVPLALAFFVMTSTGASAQSNNVERLYEEGKALLSERNFDGALTAFKTALKSADGRAGTTWQMVLAIAVTYRELDRPDFAVEYFRRFLSLTDAHKDIATQKWRDRRERVAEDLTQLEKELEKTHGFFSILSTPAGAAIRLNGVSAGADANAVTPFGLILKPGSYEVEVSAPGFAPQVKTAQVSAGQFESLQFALEAEAKKTAEKPPLSNATPEPTAIESSPTGQQTALEASLSAEETPAKSPVGAYVLFGTAGASAVAAAVASVLAAQEHKNLESLSLTSDPDLGTQAVEVKGEWRDSESAMQTYQTLSYALYGLAAASALGGLVWMLIEDPQEQAQRSTNPPRFQLNPTRRGLNANLSWSF